MVVYRDIQCSTKKCRTYLWDKITILMCVFFFWSVDVVYSITWYSMHDISVIVIMLHLLSHSAGCLGWPQPWNVSASWCSSMPLRSSWGPKNLVDLQAKQLMSKETGLPQESNSLPLACTHKNNKHMCFDKQKGSISGKHQTLLATCQVFANLFQLRTNETSGNLHGRGEIPGLLRLEWPCPRQNITNGHVHIIILYNNPHMST